MAFPAAPTAGTTFVAATGITYTFQASGGWKITSAGSPLSTIPDAVLGLVAPDNTLVLASDGSLMLSNTGVPITIAAPITGAGLIAQGFNAVGGSPALNAVITPNPISIAPNVPVNVTLASSAGTAPFTWSVLAGTLPAGLTLNTATGVLSGTPTGATATAYNFIIQVADSTGASTTSTYSGSSIRTFTDLSMATIQTGNLVPSPAITFLNGAVASPDGLNIYINTSNSSTASPPNVTRIIKYTTTPKYNMGAATNTGIFANTLSGVTSSYGYMAYGGNGTKLYLSNFNIATSTYNGINQYALSTPYDVTTMGPVISSVSFVVVGNATSIALSLDGTSLYNIDGSVIRQYTLTTPFDLNTTVPTPIATKTSIGLIGNVFQSMQFNSAGTEVMVIPSSTRKAIEIYPLGVPWDISTLKSNPVSTTGNINAQWDTIFWDEPNRTVLFRLASSTAQLTSLTY